MFRQNVNTLWAGLLLVFGSQSAWSDQPTQVVRIGETQFTIPADWELQQVANADMTTWPILADWDTQGRLLLIESGGVSKPIQEHNLKQLHRVVRLEDQDQDGVFDKRTVVATGLPFMEGVLCIGQDLLVTAPPNIYRLIDHDEDGLFEGREVWFDGQTITNCANDLHGPYLGRDGWIYWNKGAFAEQQHSLANGKTLVSSAAHTFRRKLSGGAIEVVMTGGMDNPVGLAFTPEGERFFSSTFLHHSGHGLRDGITHSVYGSLFGKVHRVIDGHVRTGSLMPVTIDLGPAAPSGLKCLTSTAVIPPQASDECILVAAQFNLQKVSAHRLRASGASFTSHNEDIVVADRIDFHPTDVLEDTDGSLLIVDTGGWYDLCCPSSRIDQKAANGGIYRLSRKSGNSPSLATRAPKKGEGNAASPEHGPETENGNPENRGPEKSVPENRVPEDIAQSLVDARPWIARQAQLQLLTMDPSAAELLGEALHRLADDAAQPLPQRLTYLWSLCTLGSEPALQAIQHLLDSQSSSVVQAACHALALHRYAPARKRIERLLQHDSLSVRRAAAEAVGRIGDVASARELLASLSADDSDRHLQHSVAYALIELEAVDASLEYLAPGHNRLQQQIAMTVVDQLGAAEQLPTEAMLAAAASSELLYQRTASEILAKHPNLVPRYIDAMTRQLQNIPASAEALLTLIEGWKDTDEVKALLTQWFQLAPTLKPAQQTWLTEALSLYADRKIEASWISPLSKWFDQAKPAQQLRIADALRRLDLADAGQLRDSLLAAAKLASDDLRRWQLLAALPVGTQLGEAQLEQRLLASVTTEDPELSQAAIAALQRIQLTADSGRELVDSLQRLSPRGLAVAVEAVSRLRDDDLALAMLTELRQLPAARTLNTEQLLNLFRHRSSALRSSAEQSVAAITQPPQDVEAKVKATLSKLPPGDAIHGLQLFRSNKAGCSSCHRLGHVGGELGPELTRIGASRSTHALLEAILFPSARLEQSFQPTKVLTHDGQIFNGLLAKHLSPTQFVLQLSADKAVVLDVQDIDRQEPSQVSIMPSGMAELLTDQELADLLAILESAK